MPACLAASMSSMPLGATTGRSSIVRLTVSDVGEVTPRPPRSVSRSPRVERACPAVDVLLVLGAELFDRRDHGAGRKVAEGAQDLAADLARQRQQQIQVAGHAAAGLDARQNLEQPRCALAARRALPARLVAEELFHE